LLLTIGASRASDSGETRLLSGLSRLEGAFALGVFADYSNRDGFSTSALVSVSAGRDPRNGVWHAQARPLASSGALSARVFLDADGSGSMDGTETALPGAGFLLNGSSRPGRTDAAGTVFLSDLPAYQEVGVTVATATLEDPYSKPASAGIRLVPRPGKVAVLEFPIVIAARSTAPSTCDATARTRSRAASSSSWWIARASCRRPPAPPTTVTTRSATSRPAATRSA
jgi:hypothetical protein